MNLMVLLGRIFVAYIGVSFALFVIGFIVALIKTFLLGLIDDHRALIARIQNKPIPSRKTDIINELDVAAMFVTKLCLLPIMVLPKLVRWCYITYISLKYKTLILTNPDPEIRKIVKKNK